MICKNGGSRILHIGGYRYGMLCYVTYVTLEVVDTAQHGHNLAPSLSAMTVLRPGG